MRNFVSKLDSMKRYEKIKELRLLGYSQIKIATTLKISQGTVSRVLLGQNCKPYKYGTPNNLIGPYRESRKLAIERLGGICVRCGFSDIRALQIDHINAGGNKERKVFGGQYGVYKDVIVNSGRYQLLCANCNWIKRYENKEVKESKYGPADLS